MWKICCRIHILVWNYRSSIVILKTLILDGSPQYVHILKFCRFFFWFAWFDTVEFILPPCPNDNRYDDVVFADRFRYQLTLFENRVLIGLPSLLHAHNAHEIDTSKIVAQFCRISYCFAWFDTVEFIRLTCPNDMTYDVWFSLIISVINFLCLNFLYW